MVPPIVKRYLLALNRYKWPGIASFLGVVGISGVVAMQPVPEPTYRSEGVLVQNFPIVAFTATGTEVQQRGQVALTEEFLLADVLLEEVSNQLSSRDIAIDPDQLRRSTRVRVEVAADGEAQVYRVLINFTWPNPEQAQTALSLMFDGMVELSRVTNRARLLAIIGALDERLPAVEAELREAEQALEAYDRLEGPAIQAALDGSLLGAISSSQQQRRDAQLALASINAQMQNLQAQLGMTPAQAFTSSALSADPIIAQLRTQILEAETQLSLVAGTLREAHPTVQELQTNLTAYNQLLEQRAAEVIGGGSLTDLPSGDQVRQNSALDPARAALANQLVALETERESLLQQQAVLETAEVDLRQQYASLPNKQLERDRLAQQVALKQALFDQIQAKRIDAEAAEAETVSSLTISKPPATLQLEADTQSPVAVMAVGSLLGVIVAGAVVFLLDMLDSTIRTPEDLEAIFRDQDVPVLGIVPVMGRRATRFKPLLTANSPYGDLYERLRSNLQLAGSQLEEGGIPKTVLVTSTQAGEGKTTTALNLGIASAAAGRRTLVIEADMKSPSQTAQLGVVPDPRAVAEPLRYYGGQVAEPIQMVPHIQNFYVAPNLGEQANAAAILESTEMKLFLERAQGRFDLVILDAPALHLRNDAYLLAKVADGLIIVTRPGLTQKPMIESGLEQLLETEDLVVLGAVVNAADVPVEMAQPQAAELVVAVPAMAALVDDDDDDDDEVREAPLLGRIDF